MNEKSSKKSSQLFFNKNLQVIFGVTLMAIMGVSSIAPVLPKVSEELKVSSELIGLLITVFTLPPFF